MSTKKVLIIGLVWPEPASSAAGKRIIQLVNLFISSGYDVIFSSAATKSEYSFDLKTLNVREREIKLNDHNFNLFLKETNPDLVLFDRFMTEEQYGWRVEQECPNALKVLDTEDLHCLRYARQQALKTGQPQPLDSINLFNDVAKREIASILRCDLYLMISEIEMKILKNQFHIDPSLLFYIPFLEDTISNKQTEQWKNFEEREGFMFIGNFLHEPNWNTLQVLKTKIWPVLRKKLPNVILHIYGAYSTQKVMQLHNKRENFHVHGRADSAEEAISKHRLLIAPIPFGAGLKGKFIEAMRVGTPSITTSIGAEAMKGDLDWNGAIEDDEGLFINQSATLYQNKKLWLQAQQNGIQIINDRYGKSKFIPLLLEKLELLRTNLTAHRQHNFIGQILHHHMINSTKYMSLWIEEKNKATL
jgi:glycosyltransferase involved in cell wall biosynthesis